MSEVEQAVYTAGHRDGRAVGFTSGETYGRAMQRNADGWRLPLGLCLGFGVGALIQPLVFWLRGVCW